MEVGEQSVVEHDRRGKVAKVTLSMVNTVWEIAGFPAESPQARNLKVFDKLDKIMYNYTND